MLTLIPAVAIAQGVKPYVSSKWYQITPLPGWTVNPNGEHGSDIIQGPRQATFTPAFSVIARPEHETIPLSSMGPLISRVYLQKYSTYRQLSQHMTTLGGVPAIETVGTYVSPKSGILMRLDSYMAWKSSRDYVFTLVVPESVSTQYETGYSDMLRTLKLSD